jgi:predicted peptidase
MPTAFAQVLEEGSLRPGPVVDHLGTTQLVNFVVETTQEARHYVLFTPAQLEADETAPLVVVAHGARGSAWHMAFRTQWRRLASERRFLVAFAQSTGQPLAGGVYAARDPVYGLVFGDNFWEVRDAQPQFERDLAYFRQLVREVKSHDPSRVYFMGHSNGAIFSCHLMTDMGDVFAAFVNSHGGMGDDPGLVLRLERALRKRKSPVLVVMGTEDEYLPFCELMANLFEFEGWPVRAWFEPVAMSTRMGWKTASGTLCSQMSSSTFTNTRRKTSRIHLRAWMRVRPSKTNLKSP